MHARSSRPTHSSDEKECRIRAAGVIQAVIASGAPVEEWRVKALYALNLCNYVAGILGGTKGAIPAIPNSLKENKNGSA